MFRGERASAHAQSIKSQIHPAFQLPDILIAPLKGSPARMLSPVGLQGWATIPYSQAAVPKLAGHTPLQTYTSSFCCFFKTCIWLIHSSLEKPIFGNGARFGEKLCPCPKLSRVPKAQSCLALKYRLQPLLQLSSHTQGAHLPLFLKRKFNSFSTIPLAQTYNCSHPTPQA